MKLCCVYFNVFPSVRIKTYHNPTLNNRKNYINKHFSNLLNSQWGNLEEKTMAVERRKETKNKKGGIQK